MTEFAALIFDFDGLILDTEVPEYRAWQEIFQHHGADLPLDEWVKCIGSSFEMFDPYDYLEEQTGRTADRDALRAEQRARHAELVSEQDLLPGVRQFLQNATASGMVCAVASSSKHAWVDHHLVNHGIDEYMSCICCRDDVAHVKPAPDLFLTAAECIGVEPSRAVAIEDSPNGIIAAKAAGMQAIAVPNSLTRGLDLSAADLILPSLAEMPLEDALRRLSG